MSSTMGKTFRVTVFGESHGRCVGCVVDGCPAGLPYPFMAIEQDLNRRRPATRDEPDKVEALSGLFESRTTGAPLCMVIWNEDVPPPTYSRYLPRPGHADFTAYMKYGGFNDYRGGGTFSGRLTAPVVAAGTLAKAVLSTIDIMVTGRILSIGGKHFPPHRIQAVCDAQAEGDTLGGIVACSARGVPTGLGEPFADTLDGELSKAIFCIPGVKGVEFGVGFDAANTVGSQNNDPFIVEEGKMKVSQNNSGGILGGISSGAPVQVRVAFKPPPSIQRSQKTINMATLDEEELLPRPNQDVCYVPRVVVVVEAVVAIVLCDFAIQSRLIPGVLK